MLFRSREGPVDRAFAYYRPFASPSSSSRHCCAPPRHPPRHSTGGARVAAQRSTMALQVRTGAPSISSLISRSDLMCLFSSPLFSVIHPIYVWERGLGAQMVQVQTPQGVMLQFVLVYLLLFISIDLLRSWISWCHIYRSASRSCSYGGVLLTCFLIRLSSHHPSTNVVCILTLRSASLSLA